MNVRPKSPAQVAFLAGEAMPALHAPPGMTGAQMYAAAAELAAKWIEEINQRSRPITTQPGTMNDYALLKVVRRALASESRIDVFALRMVLSVAQEAMVRFHDDPVMQQARRVHLRS